jgi:two-component system cell cycle sensor histidine kinase/response regulator CckA
VGARGTSSGLPGRGRSRWPRLRPAAVVRRSREYELANRLAAIVESSSDSIVSATLDGVITTWNAAAERMYGWVAEEIVGQGTSVLIPPDLAAELAPVFQRVRLGEKIEPFETRLLRKDGSAVEVWLSDSPVRDASGAVIGISAISRDVTKRNRDAAERRALEDRLRQSERLESLGQLAGGIAHDFNNLLSVIMSFAAFVAEETADRPEVAADTAQIQAAAQRAAQLTKQLLIFSRREKPQLQALDLNGIVSDTTGLLSRAIGEPIELRMDLSEDLPAIEADQGQVEQVLLNLAINARDAMPRGGILTIITSPADLRDGDTRLHPGVIPGCYAELAVTDTGTGMSPQTVARIFEPFFTTKPSGQGTGLGLATVYGIITGAGGGLHVESEEGSGTTFRLYFPTTSFPAALAPDAASSVTWGHGEMILVVDDEPAVLAATARILRQHGYATMEAGTSEEALFLAASGDTQLLLTDSVLPSMPGTTLAGHIAKLKPGLPIVYMSGYTEGLPGPQPSPGKEVARIQKPFDSQTLLETVHTAISADPRLRS